MNKILIIDDDVDLNMSLTELLEDEGFEVMSAYDGRQGLALIESEQPDLVITDIVMPNVEGTEVVLKLAGNGGEDSPKIIAMSGGGRISGKDYLAFVKEFGVDFVFEKPFDVNEFLTAVRSLFPKED